METKTAVRCYTLDWICDLCGKHPLRPTKKMVPGYPPIFQHGCAGCGHTMNFHELYPRQLFEEIPQMVEVPKIEETKQDAPVFTDGIENPKGRSFAVSEEVHREPTPQGKTLVEVFAAEKSPHEELEAALLTVLTQEKAAAKRKIKKKNK